MGAETLPTQEVSDYVDLNFEAYKLDPGREEHLAEALGTIWTPQIFLFRPDGLLVHETVGFMLPAQLLMELEFAVAKGALKSGDHGRACRLLREFSEKYPEHERTPEARFWLGLSEWRRTDSFATSAAIWKDLIARWPKTTWAARVRWEVE